MNVASDVDEHELVVIWHGAILDSKFSHHTVAEDDCVQFAFEVLLHAECKFLLDSLRLSKVDLLNMGVSRIQKPHLCLRIQHVVSTHKHD